jgi:hypothetical protein
LLNCQSLSTGPVSVNLVAGNADVPIRNERAAKNSCLRRDGDSMPGLFRASRSLRTRTRSQRLGDFSN